MERKNPVAKPLKHRELSDGVHKLLKDKGEMEDGQQKDLGN